MHHLILGLTDLKSIGHDYIRTLVSELQANAKLAQKGEY